MIKALNIVFTYLNTVLIWPDDGRSRPKHVARYNLIVIIASCLDVYCVLTVHNIQYYTHSNHYVYRFEFRSINL